MHFHTLIAALAAGAAAFPSPAQFYNVDEKAAKKLYKRTEISLEERAGPLGEAFLHESNAGLIPNTEFNAKDQYVDVRPGTTHEFRGPGKHDIRGPCPGLNAAANHGFISRSGVITLEDTTFGLAKVWNLGLDFSNPLFVFSVLNSGSIVDMMWSIGGPMKTNTLGGLLGQGLGISNSHNKYEGDSSVSRGDAYLHNGDAHSMVLASFEKLYALRDENDEFTMFLLLKHAQETRKYSIYNNPYYFQGPLAAVPPIAHQFVVAFMSNHSAERIQGFLPAETLKSIFAVKNKKNGEMYWDRGMEEIPQNFYKRPSSNMYGIPGSFGDFGKLAAAVPGFLSVGGNMGKVNSFEGVDPADFTGGVFNSANLLQGSNLACFVFEMSVAVNGDAAHKIEYDTQPFFKLAKSILGPTYAKLSCPKAEYQPGVFEKYPGYKKKYKIQPAQPY